MSDLAVDVRDVYKTYGSGELAVHALRGVDMAVARGEFMMLVGPSGSGKTTLLSILGCVLTATRGAVRIFNEDITHYGEGEFPRLRLSYIGFIFQGHNLIASLSAEENVSLLLRMRGWSPKAARREALELLARVELADRSHAKPGELSGGQKQRVAIARALAGGPPLILADEPTAALDAHTGAVVTDLLRKVCREDGRTAVVVTHDNRIFHLADRILHIEDGRIVPAEQAP